MTGERIEKIRDALDRVFAPTELEVLDESYLHAGHPGAREGKGHFRVRIVSDRFGGRTPLQRHRMVFEALGPLMYTDIHALSVQAKTPSADESTS